MPFVHEPINTIDRTPSFQNMLSQLPLFVIFVTLSPLHSAAISRLQFNYGANISALASKTWPSRTISLKSRSNLNTNPNGSTFLWLPQDEYSGKTFYEYVYSQKSTKPVVNKISSPSAALIFLQERILLSQFGCLPSSYTNNVNF